MKASVCPVCDAANELHDTSSAQYADLQAFYMGNEIRRCSGCGHRFIPEYAATAFVPAVAAGEPQELVDFLQKTTS